ncbi:MAG TPA: tRNA pseudouridine(13) synthase TruD [Gemmataceae bacterium]|nr:tRNA pseudouridine(13) synthase TruD [Gemmataceae bacterium]
MGFDPLLPPPLLTADLPGIGGRIKQFPEDFEVEEIPAYEPCGTGEYLYLWIEKRGMGAEFFIRQVARRLGISPGEVGSAGLKDRQAVTRQMISVPDVGEERLPQLDGEGIRVLRISRHGNKLKPGHLHGNRFRILIRDPVAADERLPPLLDRLQRQGFANYYGPQRFGHAGETVQLGLSLLGSSWNAERGTAKAAGRRMPRAPFLRRLALSAAQAALFNHYLGRRLQDGLLPTVMAGDVMAKRPFGGLFVAADVPQEQARFEAGETVHTGPIFGRKMFAAAHAAAAREAAALADAGLTTGAFFGFGKLLQGTRRHNLVYPDELAAERIAEGVRLTFRLPAGSYATVLLCEIMKSQTMATEEEAS